MLTDLPTQLMLMDVSGKQILQLKDVKDLTFNIDPECIWASCTLSIVSALCQQFLLSLSKVTFAFASQQIIGAAVGTGRISFVGSDLGSDTSLCGYDTCLQD